MGKTPSISYRLISMPCSVVETVMSGLPRRYEVDSRLRPITIFQHLLTLIEIQFLRLWKHYKRVKAEKIKPSTNLLWAKRLFTAQLVMGLIVFRYLVPILISLFVIYSLLLFSELCDSDSFLAVK